MDRGNGEQSAGEFFALARPPQGLDHHPTAGLVVHCRRDGKLVRQRAEGQLYGHRITDTNHSGGLFLVGRANVEPEVLHLRRLLPLLFGEQMDRFSGDQAEDRPGLGPDGHPLTDEHLGVPPSDRLNVQKAVFVDVLNDQADLVAMAGQHHAQRGVRIFCHNQVAVQVGADLVGERRHVIADDLLQGAFVARGAGQLPIVFGRNRGL